MGQSNLRRNVFNNFNTAEDSGGREVGGGAKVEGRGNNPTEGTTASPPSDAVAEASSSFFTLI